ncbi:MAG: type VI secretion system tip protein TssI/VgrG, partial [Pseudomonadota bacterium]
MGALAEVMAAVGSLGSGLSQHARLLTLASAQDADLPETLAAEHFSGREGINELYCFTVDALSVSTDLALTILLGEELTVTLLQADGSRRAWHGICTSAEGVGADGGVARYQLRLEPALAALQLRRDSYIFHDCDARGVITELLRDYPQVEFDFDLSAELGKRPIWTQYRESDFDFLQRVLAAEGINWRFEHAQGDAGADAHARHKVVFFDRAATAPATPGGATLRFHGVRATDSDDAIDQFAARRQVQPNAVSLSSWDPAQLLAPAAQHNSSVDNGMLPDMAIHDGGGERRDADASACDARSLRMLQARELDNKTFNGAGAVRRLAPGHGFTLSQHAGYGEGEDGFTVLWVTHEARNNLDMEQSGAAAGGDERIAPGTYRNRFACVRDSVAIVPRASAQRLPYTAPGPQGALVVGLPGAVSDTNRDHQVKVQFNWQRGTAGNPGGQPHNTDARGNAPGDDTSGTWVRVAEALAGPNWGTQFTPRIGTEVLIDFVEGDIDRPVIVAQLYTGGDAPPYAAGVDSGVNHAGVLSGIHSHNFGDGGYNQWQIDDSPGQLRTRLATSSAATQLNLGYLIAQAPSSAQRGSYRGAGFELRTDAWGVVRAGEGILLTTSARTRQGSGVASSQLDAAEALGKLKGAQALGQALGGAARQQQALVSKDGDGARDRFMARIDPGQDGKHAGPVGGHGAQKNKSGTREPDAAQAVEKLGAPLVLLDAAAGMNWATPASTVLFAGQQMHWSTQGDTHLASGHTSALVAANSVSYFTHAGGIQAIAGNGPLSLQAHTDQLEILADKAVTITSVNDVIAIKANQTITLQA